MGNADAWPNITLKKIPNAVLGRCEFGKDDYSLHVAALPDAEPSSSDPDSVATPAATPTSRTRKRKVNAQQTSLLPGDDE